MRLWRTPISHLLLCACLIVSRAQGVDAQEAPLDVPQIDLPAPADAQVISMESLLQRFAQGNPEIQRARFAVRTAQAQVLGTAALLQYTLTAQANLLNAEQPSNEGLSSGIARNQNYNAEVSLARQFAPGTRIELSLQNGVSRSVFPFSSPAGTTTITRGPNVGTTLSLSASQPLLRGLGRNVTLLPLLLAQRRLDTADLQVVQAASTRLVEVVTAAAELAFAVQELQLRHRSLERTLTQLQIGMAELDAGRIASIELDLIRQRVATNQEAVLVTWATAATRTRELQRLLGEPPDASAVWAVEPPHPDVDWTNPQALCSAAAERSPDIAALQAQVETARADLIRTRNGLRPQLDLTAGLTQSGLDTAFFPSYGQVVRLEATTVTAGLLFSLPLGNAAARDEHERARVAVEQAEFEVHQSRTNLCHQLTELAASRDTLLSRTELAAYRVALAERALQAEQARFAQGLSTVQTGLQALEDLETAERERLRLQTDDVLNGWRAWHLTGRLAEELLRLADGAETDADLPAAPP